MNAASQTGTTNDSIVRLKPSVARALFKDALQKPILLERIAIFNDRIATKDSIIQLMQSAANRDEGAIMELNQQKKDLIEERDVLTAAIASKDREITTLTRNLKFQKGIRNTLFVAVAAAAVKLFIIKN